MPNDYITIKALSNELNDTLKSGKIDRITMPEKDEVNLFVRAFNKNYILAISCNAQNPRIHLTSIKKQSPITAPSFCMHLRKYFLNGIVEKIETLNEDRIICISCKSKNELRDEVTYRLVIEMMGRYSNIVVLNSKDIITDALKQVSFDMMTKRHLIPGAKYLFVEQTKYTLSQIDEIKTVLKNFNQDSLSKYLLTNISGVAKNTVDEIIFRSNIPQDCNNLNSVQIDSLIENLKIFNEIYSTKEYKPCVSYINDVPQDFYVTNYASEKNIKYFNTLNDAIEDTLSKKDEHLRKDEKTKFLSKAYNAFLSKAVKRLEKSTQRLSEAQNRDSYKLFGELIISNIYRINKGDKEVICQNYYSENLEDIKIKLDENLSPQQNASQFFKKYAKLKHQEEVALKQIEELKVTIEYLKSIENFIKIASTDQDIKDLKKELEDIGALKKTENTKGKKKEKESAPLHYVVEGFDIFVGKNNLQNDKITFKLAQGSDMWLHAKSFHGSHVVIIVDNKPIPNSVLEIACQICAFYSTNSNATKTEVDYTLRKNVKRHPNKKPGMVLYDIYQSANVEPKQNKEYLKN